MIAVAEFTPSQEVLTATLHQTMETGESYVGPIHVGHYTDSSEVWIEWEGLRIGIEADHMPAFIKQLCRAAKLAATHGKEGA